ncbi:uncharacterized protein B0H18DRAFT_975966 [Fomitopsis serialis]|uniref:uncharacterized protein n=1 Tax=Fomitopsis serialis TaxID=139415 RepID=UPI002008032A|nr:uncharacterized protein B0H18DRAFT_975966 [Neoantrodia serialis]KAH9935497.1 hypothetical protein B0H18DRAFT_975966 [Neoantrodia serialis]
MVFTLSGSQKVPGTPVRAPSVPTEQSPGTNYLAGFSFSRIGQEPSLLKRLSSADQDQELQYPSSRSSPSLPDEHAASAASSQTAPHGVPGSLLGVTLHNATPLREVTMARASVAPTTDDTTTSVAGSSSLSAHPISPTAPGGSSTHYPEFVQSHRVDTTHSSLAPAKAARLSITADASTASLRPSLPTSAGASASTPFQEAPRGVVAQEASPSDLIARISQVAVEKAEWSEMKTLLERYRREHEELLQRTEESARAYSREREQASKVSAVADTAFGKLETLLLRQEERLAAEQQQAESALADTQRVIADRQARESTEAEEASRAAEAERARKAHAEVEERRKAAEEEARRIAAEEAAKQRAAAEEIRKAEAQRQQAEQEIREAEEKRRVEGEQRRAAAAAAEAAEAAAEEERRKNYDIKRAEADEKKRVQLEAVRIEARQMQEKRPKPAKEELKARLEKEKREAASRSSSVSSSSTKPPANAERKQSANGSTLVNANAPVAVAQPPAISPSVAGLSTLPVKPVTTKAQRPVKLQTASNKGKESGKFASGAIVNQQAQLGGVLPSSGVANGTQAQQTNDSLPSNVQSRSELHTPKRVSQASVKAETVTPRIPHETPAQAGASAATSGPATTMQDESPSTSELPDRTAKALKAVQRSGQRGQGNSSSKRATPAGEAKQPAVKQEQSPDVGELPARSLNATTVPQSTGVGPHVHTNKLSSTGSLASNVIRPRPTASSSNPMHVRDTQHPSHSSPSLQTGTLPPSQSLTERLRVPEAYESQFQDHYEDPWVNTVESAEDHLHRRGEDVRDDRPSSRPAYDHYSPPRDVTPPLPQRISSREYDHYSPNPGRPPRREAYRKRLRSNENTWANDDERPPRRARISPPNDPPQRRRVTAPTPLEQPDWPSTNERDARWSPPPHPQARAQWQSDSLEPYDNGYAAHPVRRDGVVSRSHYDAGPTYTVDPPNFQAGYDHASGTTSTNDSLPQTSSWSEDHGVPLQERIAEPESRSGLLARMSDSWQAVSNGRNNRKADRSPPRSVQRGRGAISTGRGRGRGISTKNGVKERSLQSRLTGGEGLGARLS